MDYFENAKYIIDDELEGVRKEVAEIINSDIEKYKEFSIKRNDCNQIAGTNIYSFRAFLNDYSIAINVFGLYSELDCRGSFNRFITSQFQELSMRL